MSKNKDKKEKSPVIVKVSPDETYVENNKKPLSDKCIFTIDSDENASPEDYNASSEDYDALSENYYACSEDYDACSDDYYSSCEGSKKKETIITTNFATPPRPKK
ncbi:hypothetical protein H5119_13765 [Pseudoalteromonas sp. SG45-5]|uniref:hypothetical protein n=1 Tax=unclassified Pseudoalteromonas TaxID=194690 RepID=UPI0015FD6367|nr:MULTISPECIES: hypothetical protein [unclassified Pseudoalteromonas]MBB1386593.1 hypothetical protein [Pseudoalteromonas sp. SG45-5]MBB1394631.1 hypothetical protein [Pseudoalteromonas sp. SG44-4]MBB1449164.1 hypothetical protein [Pseudoalteromonas sp. SG41-6]